MKENNNKKSDASILLINSEKIGDIIICLDLINSITFSCKYTNIFILINEKVASLLKKTNLNVRVLSYNHSKFRCNLFYRIRTIKKIRELNVKYAVNISPERGSINDEVTILSGAKIKIGLKTNSRFIPSILIQYYNKYYSLFIDSKINNEYYALDDLLKYLGVDKRENENLFFDHENEMYQRGNYILIAPSASESFRNWNQTNFKLLAQKLRNVTNLRFVFIGTYKQYRIVKYISEGISNTIFKIDLHFSEIIQLVDKCKLFIGLDSGITHIALQMGKPLIAIIGGGMYGRSFPYKISKYSKYFYHEMDCFGCNWVCKYKEPYCLTRVNVEDVLWASIELLDIK